MGWSKVWLWGSHVLLSQSRMKGTAKWSHLSFLQLWALWQSGCPCSSHWLTGHSSVCESQRIPRQAGCAGHTQCWTNPPNPPGSWEALWIKVQQGPEDSDFQQKSPLLSPCPALCLIIFAPQNPPHCFLWGEWRDSISWGKHSALNDAQFTV